MKRTWLICPTCSGNGSHSLRFGAITEADRLDWSAEELADYMRGDYAEPCETCDATGKVLAVEPIRRARYFNTQSEADHHREMHGWE